MDVKSLLGDAWKEGMSLEEIDAALADKELVDAKSLPKSVSKDTFDKTASELAKLKKELADLKASSMTEAERLKAAQQEAEQLKAQYQKQIARVKAQEVFAKAGLGEEDYGTILEGIVSDNEELTLGLASNMVGLLTKQKAAAEKALRAELLKQTPTPPPGTPTPPKDARATYEDLMKKVQENPNDMALKLQLFKAKDALKEK